MCVKISVRIHSRFMNLIMKSAGKYEKAGLSAGIMTKLKTRSPSMEYKCVCLMPNSLKQF